eukprot:TRINITY_DN2381_c0_g2_i3.p1 TRINITY_DN2381_c0_g2~~TRINITY_DN2381_c0_g2_i3.p1  ORF type:complete len:1108 (-),score=91.89 TRINITY_DN2381_c0_g2_i3:1754-5077(-)
MSQKGTREGGLLVQQEKQGQEQRAGQRPPKTPQGFLKGGGIAPLEESALLKPSTQNVAQPEPQTSFSYETYWGGKYEAALKDIEKHNPKFISWINTPQGKKSLARAIKRLHVTQEKKGIDTIGLEKEKITGEIVQQALEKLGNKGSNNSRRVLKEQEYLLGPDKKAINPHIEVVEGKIHRHGLRVVAFNAQSLNSKKGMKRKRLDRILEKEDPDVVLICEANTTSLNNTRYETFISQEQGIARGTVIMVRRTIPVEKIFEDDGHMMAIRLKRPNIKIAIAHLNRLKTAQKISTILDEIHTRESPFLLYTDANQWLKVLNGRARGIRWTNFRNTWRCKNKLSSPDKVGRYRVEVTAKAKGFISDHRWILIDCRTVKIEECFSMFPYSKKKLMENIVEKGSENWPEEEMNFLKEIKAKSHRNHSPLEKEALEVENYLQYLRNRYYSEILKAVEGNDMKKVHGFIKRNGDKPPGKLALFIEEENSVTSISESEDKVLNFFKKIYVREGQEIEELQEEFLILKENEEVPKGGNKALGQNLTPDTIFHKKNGRWLYPELVEKFGNWARTGRLSIPEYMKRARLILLSKNGSNTCPLDKTRPISILGPEYKAIEAVIMDRIGGKIWENIPECQTGFRRGCSTHTNLIKVLNFIRRVNLTKERVTLMSIDIKKAYDNVNRSILLKKLEEIGIPRNEYLIYRELLTNTSIWVGEKSLYTNRGLPQGSILSPMMFNLYMADKLRNLEKLCKVWAYADNILLGVPNKRVKVVEKEIDSWKESIELEVDWGKCEAMAKKGKVVKTKAKSVQDMKYLGIHLTMRHKSRIKAMFKRMAAKRFPSKNKWMSKIPFGGKRFVSIWYDAAYISYQMYPYLALEMVDKEDVDQFWTRALRYRLQIPRFVDNNSVNRLLGIIPSMTMQWRARREGYRKFIIGKEGEGIEMKYWSRVFTALTPREVANIWWNFDPTECKCARQPPHRYQKIHFIKEKAPITIRWKQCCFRKKLYEAMNKWCVMAERAAEKLGFSTLGIKKEMVPRILVSDLQRAQKWLKWTKKDQRSESDLSYLDGQTQQSLGGRENLEQHHTVEVVRAGTGYPGPNSEDTRVDTSSKQVISAGTG